MKRTDTLGYFQSLLLFHNRNTLHDIRDHTSTNIWEGTSSKYKMAALETVQRMGHDTHISLFDWLQKGNPRECHTHL